jgi:hypothetical protein
MSARPFGRAAAIAMIMIGALAGCGHSKPTAITGLGDVSPGPTAAASPSDTPTPTPSASPSASTPKPATFPKTAQGYAQAGLDAYGKGNTARLTDLTTAGSKAQFDDVHPSNTHWHYHDCEGAAGSSYCTFDNDNGDRFQIQIDNNALGSPHGIINVVINVTTYPGNAHDYVNAFMQAFFDVNTFRMRALSSTNLTSYFTHFTPQESWSLSEDGAAGHTYVHITNADGFDQYVEVENDKLGHQHAIVDHCDNSTCS